uniref:Tc1-like transposase DDE domain-containing protein n=1 Tax=Plectus sambesii TaxID=2011161 RepID=A0A914VGZ7_9BILA
MIASVMGVKRTTISSIISKLTKEGRVETQQHGGVKTHKLTEDQKCLAAFGVAVSSFTIGRILKAFAYTIKQVHLQPVRRNDAAAIEARWQYAQTFLDLFAQVSEAHIYFIDDVAPGLRSRNISICCAMNSQQVLHYTAKTRANNREFFCTFLEELFLKLAEQGVTNAVLVMDNVPFHKGERVRALIESHGHRVLYLPPYSLFLNPIENMC